MLYIIQNILLGIIFAFVIQYFILNKQIIVIDSMVSNITSFKKINKKRCIK